MDFIDFHCGCGGMGLAAKRVGFTLKAAVDIQPHACETYNRNLKPEDIIIGDVADAWDKIEQGDVVAFNLMMTNGSIFDKYRKYHEAYLDVFKYIKKHKPIAFIAEDSKRFKSQTFIDKQRKFWGLCNKAGYNIFDQVINYADYGVPQFRERYIVIGLLKKKFRRPYLFPQPTHGKDNYITAGDVLAFIPPDVTQQHIRKIKPENIERIKLIEQGQNAFTANLPMHMQVTARVPVKNHNHYFRLDPRYPTKTVQGEANKVPLHPTLHRYLTIRENCRLQTIPDSYMFYGNKQTIYKQVGMATPPVGIEPILRQLKKLLEK